VLYTTAILFQFGVKNRPFFTPKKIYRKNGVKHELSDSNPAKTEPYYPIKTPGAIAPGALFRI